MSVGSTLAGRVTMDPAAFARFCETPSIEWCGPGPRQIAVDSDGDRFMLETGPQDMAALRELRNLLILPDLRKAARAGRVDGAFMTACDDGDRSLEAFVFDNSVLWAGWDDCINEPVTIGECEASQADVESVEQWKLAADGSDIKHRVRWAKQVQHCNCEGYDAYGDALCRNSNGSFAEDDTVVDITTFMPARAAGKLEQALHGVVGTVNAEGRRQLGRIAWRAAGWKHGPEHPHMFRRWLEAIPEAAGERYVMFTHDLFDPCMRIGVDMSAELFEYRPVCANPDTRRRGLCPAFLVSDTATPDTIRVPAHVGNTDLANAAKLAADRADPAEAVAIIAAITRPDQA